MNQSPKHKPYHGHREQMCGCPYYGHREQTCPGGGDWGEGWLGSLVLAGISYIIYINRMDKHRELYLVFSNKVKVKVLVAQSCPTLCLLGSSVHRIL